MNPIKRYFQYYAGFPSRIYRNLWANLFYYWGEAIRYFLPLYFISYKHLSLSAMAGLFSMLGLGEIIGSYCGGRFGEHYSMQAISLLAISLRILSIAGLIFMASDEGLSLLLAAYGFSTGCFRTANTLFFLEDGDQHDLSRLNGLRRMILNLGLGLAGFIGGVCFNYGILFLLWVCIGFQGVSFVLILMDVQTHSVGVRRIKKISKETPGSIRCFFKNQNFIKITGVCLLINFIFFQLYTTYPLYLYKNYAMSHFAYGAIFSFNAIAIIFMEVPILYHLKKYSLKKVAALGALFIGLGLLMLPWAFNLIGIYVSVILWTLGEILFFSNLQTMALNSVIPEQQGRAMGIYQAITAISKILAPSLGLFLYSFQAGFWLWLLCGIIGSLCFFILILSSMKKRDILLAAEDVRSVIANTVKQSSQ